MPDRNCNVLSLPNPPFYPKNNPYLPSLSFANEAIRKRLPFSPISPSCRTATLCMIGSNNRKIVLNNPPHSPSFCPTHKWKLHNPGNHPNSLFPLIFQHLSALKPPYPRVSLYSYPLLFFFTPRFPFL